MKAELLNPSDYIRRFTELDLGESTPWNIPGKIESLLQEKIKRLSGDYTIHGQTAIHKTATVEQGVIMKGVVVIGPHCFVGAHAYIRGGVLLEENCVVGPGCEVKSSVIFRKTALAHFNFVGDSIVGEGVNMEAGSVIANHFNERTDKTIYVQIDGQRVALPVTKFGALVGDHTRIGANGVLSPGTILKPHSIVDRLQLVGPA